MFDHYSQQAQQSQRPTKTVKLILNGSPSMRFDLSYHHLTTKEIMNWAFSKWSLANKNGSNQKIRIFSSQGVEYEESDLCYVKNNATLYVSRGEEFDSNKNFGQYELIRVLGEGGFGQVSLAQNVNTQQYVAIKVLKPNRLGSAQDIDMIFRQAENMKSLSHPHIVNILNCYTLKQMKMVVVMQYMEGGELLARLKLKKRFCEKEARHFFKQLIGAVDYCHQRNIIHRDLKLQNILLGSQLEEKDIERLRNSSSKKIQEQQRQFCFNQDEHNLVQTLEDELYPILNEKLYTSQQKIEYNFDQPPYIKEADLQEQSQSQEQRYPIIKVADFGISGVADKYNAEIEAGTLKYMAPEVLAKKQKSNTPAVDIWACGVILFYMVCGKLPFEAPDTMKKIIAGQFQFPDFNKLRKIEKSPISQPHRFQPVSPECQDIIRKMLVVDPKKRAKIWDIECDPWFTDEGKRTSSPKSPVRPISERKVKFPSVQRISEDIKISNQLDLFSDLNLDKHTSFQEKVSSMLPPKPADHKEPRARFMLTKPGSLNLNEKFSSAELYSRRKEHLKSTHLFKKNEINPPRAKQPNKWTPMLLNPGSATKPVIPRKLQKEKNQIMEQLESHRLKMVPNRLINNQAMVNSNDRACNELAASKRFFQSEARSKPKVESQQKDKKCRIVASKQILMIQKHLFKNKLVKD